MPGLRWDDDYSCDYDWGSGCSNNLGGRHRCTNKQNGSHTIDSAHKCSCGAKRKAA